MWDGRSTESFQTLASQKLSIFYRGVYNRWEQLFIELIVKIVFWIVEVHRLWNEKGQKHPVRGWKEKVSRIATVYDQGVQSEREPYVKEDREVLEERDRD
jgi:hypothetical protein